MSHETNKKSWDSLKGYLVLLFTIGFVIFFYFFSQSMNASTLQKSMVDSFESMRIDIVSYQPTTFESNAKDREETVSLVENLKNNQLYMTFYNLFKTDITLGDYSHYLVKTDDGKEYIASVDRKYLVVEINEKTN